MAVTSLDRLNSCKSFMDLYERVMIICSFPLPFLALPLLPFPVIPRAAAAVPLPVPVPAWIGMTVMLGTRKLGTIFSEKLMAAGGATGVKGGPGVLAVMVVAASGVFAVNPPPPADRRLFIEKD